jgi:Mlc titration factor MtfA (ptsG expression regulator)
VLGDEADYDEWARVLSREFAALEKSVESGSDGLLDDYALHSPAEFFAVATEVFFEKPREMKRMLPELYAQLGKYYRVDPAAWS